MSGIEDSQGHSVGTRGSERNQEDLTGNEDLEGSQGGIHRDQGF